MKVELREVKNVSGEEAAENKVETEYYVKNIWHAVVTNTRFTDGLKARVNSHKFAHEPHRIEDNKQWVSEPLQDVGNTAKEAKRVARVADDLGENPGKEHHRSAEAVSCLRDQVQHCPNVNKTWGNLKRS